MKYDITILNIAIIEDTSKSPYFINPPSFGKAEDLFDKFRSAGLYMSQSRDSSGEFHINHNDNVNKGYNCYFKDFDKATRKVGGSFKISPSGYENPIKLIHDLCVANKWSAYDEPLKKYIDMNQPELPLWEEYLKEYESARKNYDNDTFHQLSFALMKQNNSDSEISKKWWQFWR